MKMQARIRTARRGGFTLIELVMVLVILAALAALVIPVVDYIRRTSDKTSASFAMKQVVENIGMFRTTSTEGRYPMKLDSLMAGTGAADSTTPLSTLKLGSKVKVDSLTLGELNRLDDMFKTVMQHDTSKAYRGFQGNSGVHEVGAGSGQTVNQTSYLVVVDPDIINSIYPNAAASKSVVSPNGTGRYPNMVDVPGGEQGMVALNAGPDKDPSTTEDNSTARLIALGVGPSNDAVGKTMQAAPAYAAVDGTKDYNRFIALFAVYDGFAVNKRPQLKGALDSTGDFLDQELIEVQENAAE